MGAPLPLIKHNFQPFQLHPKVSWCHITGPDARTRPRLEFVPHVSSKYHLVVPSSLDASAWRFFQATMGGNNSNQWYGIHGRNPANHCFFLERNPTKQCIFSKPTFINSSTEEFKNIFNIFYGNSLYDLVLQYLAWIGFTMFHPKWHTEPWFCSGSWGLGSTRFFQGIKRWVMPIQLLHLPVSDVHFMSYQQKKHKTV